MLLESASQEHVDSRYHILSAEPLATIETHGCSSIIHEGAHSSESDADPLGLLEQLQIRLLGTPAPQDESALPFTGGAMGLLGYDLGRRFERLPQLAEADLCVPDLAMGIYDWAWVLDRQTQQAHLLVRGTEEDLARRWAWWQTMSSTPLPQAPFTLTDNWCANMDEAGYRQRFEQVQAYLLSGDCYQINLTQRFCAPYSGDAWLAYCRLSEENRAPFSAFIRLPQASILSLSPERFLALEQGKVSTKPIKGTRPRHADQQADEAAMAELAHAEKDRAENLMIVDLLRNDLGRVCLPGSVKVPSLFAVESFPAVHHLVSTITGELDPSYSATDLLRACFPGGSITGAPKIRAMEIIEELEPQRRSAYCGSIGYLSQHGRMDTSITIRTLIAEAGRLYVWAGGGLVADSRVDDEYAETFH
ncbi:MAG: aminodeoxychorismate synthase component I, partial [Aeromonadaceae bacterium]